MMECKNCSNIFEGRFCNSCGEKLKEDKDFTMSKILSDAFSSITNFDSKIFKTLQLLFFFPGKLSKKYIQGITVPFVKPFQLFLIANIVFFFFLSDMDIFRSPAKWFFQDDINGIPINDIVDKIALKNKISRIEVAVNYDARSTNLAKGLIIILIPFIALVGKLLHYGKKMEFAKHVIFAIHFFSFFLLTSVLVTQIVNAFNIDLSKWFFIVPIALSMISYYVVGIKNFYESTWILAILKGVVSIFFINVLFSVYKVCISMFSLYSI